ncbi:DUF2993 domain-containing protein [Streptomyces sp. NPDC049585]|uniref:LmeA family phospholipid-binding protein n=1 Tax=Streptomyces sp. NPDC049585 TaxID=3155154 RepID=UPI0034459299
MRITPARIVAADEPWSPPNHRRGGPRSHRKRRRRRRAAGRPYRTATKLLFAALAGVAILLLADRCAAMYAEKKAQQQVQKALHLQAQPQVDIRGFPFLTQVVGKRLRQVDVTVPHVAADRVSLARVHASARDIRLHGDLPADIRGAVIGRLEGNVLLAFDDMNRELGASQVRFSDLGGNAIGARGRLAVAGQELVVRARAHLRRTGDDGIATEIDGMSLDIPRVATYHPGGTDKRLVLHREAAEHISKDMARVKALLSVPAIAERLGVPAEVAAQALRSEERLHQVAGTPRFVEELTRLNLVDVLAEHPWLLEKLGVDPKLLTALSELQPPELADRLSLSFQLPSQAKEYDLRLQAVTVERDGIRADLSATALPVGSSGSAP